MSTNFRSSRWLQLVGWAVAGVFIAGFFLPVVGVWTGALVGVWFVGTQKPRRGFLWQMAFAFIPGVLTNWRRFPVPDARHALEYVAWMLLIALIGALPFLCHRLLSPHLPGILETFPLPLSGAAIVTLAAAWLPRDVLGLYPLAHAQRDNALLMHIGGTWGIGAVAFFVYWLAALVLRMWNHEFRIGEAKGSAETHPGSWAERTETVELLRSPFSGSPLDVVREQGREELVSATGERFPIHDGIPDFVKAADLTGSNRKYNRLYETIGGFYDDGQRVWSALSGMDRDAYVRSYLGLLEFKPGDSVLETSVGTGLNFKYLPRGIRRFGLDLSAGMLACCQTNLCRWRMEADLFLGNAESLPFADSSFDVVFHVGGINFFNDRARAIREMIRVARPGSRILIADETEEHVKSAYERVPWINRYFKNRRQAVVAPVDLVPPEMLEIHCKILEVMGKNRFYALTFRKPNVEEAVAGGPTRSRASGLE